MKKEKDLIGRWLELRRVLTRTPKNSKEATETLNKLLEMNKHFNPNFERDWFMNKEQSSKRCNRLIKMYWAFKRREAI